MTARRSQQLERIAISGLRKTFDWRSFTSEEVRVLSSMSVELASFLKPHIREFLARVTAANAPAHRFEPLPLSLDGRPATVGSAIRELLESHGSVDVSYCYGRNACLWPDLSESQGSIIFPDFGDRKGRIGILSCLYWNGTETIWSSVQASSMVQPGDRIPVLDTPVS
jgi:hypothetical protein